MIKIMLDPGHGAGKSHNRGFKTIKDIETDVKDKMYQKRYRQEGGDEWTK